MRFSFLLLTTFLLTCTASENCRSLTLLDEIEGKALRGHVIKSFGAENCELCWIQCFLEEKCVSYNCGNKTCDLNSSDHIFHPDDLVEDRGKVYRGTQNACIRNNCPSNATCLNGFTDKGYKCKCPPGFTGENCEKAIVHGGWTSWSTWSPCSAQNCKEQGNRTRYRSCTNPAPENGGDPCKGTGVANINCKANCTCKDHLENRLDNSTVNKAYMILTDAGMIPVYCHMTELPGCGAGWTLVMKIDGSKTTFEYNSHYWNDTKPYNEKDGLTGLDDEETKLPTYWSTPFTKICLGMKVGGETRFLMIEKSAPSLHSLIADGKFKHTSLGREAWQSMIIGSSLQPNCNKEGFNADCLMYAWARIEILSNNEHDCGTCDSRIGFGTGGFYVPGNTCGNVALYGGNNGFNDVRAMCYIFVQ